MNNKFSYNFQPATIPSYQMPGSKSANRNVGLGLGNLPLPKPMPKGKLDLLGANHYKFWWFYLSSLIILLLLKLINISWNIENMTISSNK